MLQFLRSLWKKNNDELCLRCHFIIYKNVVVHPHDIYDFQWISDEIDYYFLIDWLSKKSSILCPEMGVRLLALALLKHINHEKSHKDGTNKE